jgi:hypothetical protein
MNIPPFYDRENWKESIEKRLRHVIKEEKGAQNDGNCKSSSWVEFSCSVLAECPSISPYNGQADCFHCTRNPGTFTAQEIMEYKGGK